MNDHKRRIEKLERQTRDRKEEVSCKFCGAPPKRVWRDFILFQCGSRLNDLKPGTMTCWAGFVWKLQERIGALEDQVNRKKAKTIREMAVSGGWHP